MQKYQEEEEEKEDDSLDNSNNPPGRLNAATRKHYCGGDLKKKCAAIRCKQKCLSFNEGGCGANCSQCMQLD